LGLVKGGWNHLSIFGADTRPPNAQEGKRALVARKKGNGRQKKKGKHGTLRKVYGVFLRSVRYGGPVTRVQGEKCIPIIRGTRCVNWKTEPLTVYDVSGEVSSRAEERLKKESGGDQKNQC